MVKSLLLIIVLFVNFNSQSQSVETNFNDHHYLLIDSNWHLFYPGKNKLIKTENLIYVKLYSMTCSNINFIENDFGLEPNENSNHFYLSSDIWTRNSYDGIEKHQNPEYVAGDVEYRWFDEDGNLVAEGMDLTINNGVSETYQLVVFDLFNGITDDDYVNVTIDDHEIESISPNPTNTGQIDVHYNIDGTANAYLMVIENGIIRNYMVTNTTSKIIQTSNFSNGTHTILLICDGVIKDSKQFVKI